MRSCQRECALVFVEIRYKLPKGTGIGNDSEDTINFIEINKLQIRTKSCEKNFVENFRLKCQLLKRDTGVSEGLNL